MGISYDKVSNMKDTQTQKFNRICSIYKFYITIPSHFRTGMLDLGCT